MRYKSENEYISNSDNNDLDFENNYFNSKINNINNYERDNSDNDNTSISANKVLDSEIKTEKILNNIYQDNFTYQDSVKYEINASKYPKIKPALFKMKILHLLNLYNSKTILIIVIILL